MSRAEEEGREINFENVYVCEEDVASLTMEWMDRWQGRKEGWQNGWEKKN